MRDGGGAGDHLGSGEHPAVTLRIRPLGDDYQVDPFRTECPERAEQSVDVSADTSPVGGDARGVDEHSWGATGGHEATPKFVGQITRKSTPEMHHRDDGDTASVQRYDRSTGGINPALVCKHAE
ncbi:hypothetical protein Acsp02_86580 [Actinoplanes sp. NBRC 103695]|nr:hypothetical protein Acsp02_86580 [Actinoplanes sp. NBRC 103695]